MSDTSMSIYLEDEVTGKITSSSRCMLILVSDIGDQSAKLTSSSRCILILVSDIGDQWRKQL
jgi:hypothetical protein